MNVRLLACATLIFSAAALLAQSAGSVAGWGDGTLNQLAFPPDLTNIVSVSSGSSHSVALRNDGTVVVWGQNTDGQISTKPSNLSGVAAIAAGAYHTVALRSNGTVVAWGREGGETNVPASATSVMAVAAGDGFGLALKSNGTVVAWGNISASIAATLSQVTKIAAGASHALALKSSGVIVAWGGNGGRQTNVPAGLFATQIAAGESHSLALRNDGVVVGWGNNFYGQSTNASAPTTGVKSIFAGRNHSGALRNNGSIVCWGDNTYGQVSPIPPLTHVTSVTSGGAANHNLAVVLDPPSIDTQPQSQSVAAGQLATFNVVAAGSPPLYYQWRKDGTNLPAANAATFFVNNAQTTNMGGYSVLVTNSVGSITSVVATLTVNSAPSITAHPQAVTVGVNGAATFNVAAVGTAPLRYQWRKNGTNIANATNSSYTNNSIQFEDAGNYSVSVSNTYGGLVSSNAFLTVLPGPGFPEQPVSQVALPGSSVTFRATVTNATGMQWLKYNTVIPGATSSFFPINRAQQSDGGSYALRAWNEFGTNTSVTVTLGVQNPSSSRSDLVLWGESSIAIGLEYVDMTPPAGLTGVVAVAMGQAHNLALRANGSVVGWGDNQYGQAGLPPGVFISALAAGGGYTLAITNGKVGAWGLNSSGQASPPNVSSVAAIAAGFDFSVAVLTNGAVTNWGNVAIPPNNATNVVSVSAGAEHVLAVRRDGTVVAWGGNTYSQVRAPFAVTNLNAAVMRVAAGAFHSLALKSNGTVVAWGKGTWGQTNVPPEATNIVAIAAGGDHSVALRADGKVICWGYDNWGQSETPPNLIATAIAAAGDRTLAVGQIKTELVSSITVSSNVARVVIRSSDGQPIDPASLGQIVVVASSEIGPSALWVALTNTVTLINGAAVVEDTAGAARRFYKVQQQP